MTAHGEHGARGRAVPHGDREARGLVMAGLAALAAGLGLEERLRRLRAEAAAARAAGDLRLALRTNLFALVLGLGRTGDLVYRDAWTNRELLARGKPSKAVRALLEPLVRELEPKEFGSGDVLPSDVDRLEALVEEHLDLRRGSPA